MTYTAPVETSAAEIAFTETVMSTPAPTCRRANIAEAIRVVLTDLSGIPEEELIGNASYLELGFDSLLLTQVSKALGNQFGIDLTLRDLMGNLDNIDALVAHLDVSLPAERYRPAMVAAPVAPAAPVVSVISAPAAPVNGGAMEVQAPAPNQTSFPVYSAATVNANGLEGVIAQQLELMRQQIALLQGGAANPASNPNLNPKLNPLLNPPTVAPVPAKQAEACTPTPSSNVSAPTTSINRNLDDTLTERQQRHLDELVSKYVAKTRTSKELTAKYRQWHADPRTVSGFNRRWKEMIYQIAVQKSKGSRLVDVDGNEYIDLLNGFGPNFLGHSPDFVTEALKAQLDRGVEVGPQCVNAMEAARLFCEITGNERASFVNTGSEAVQAAMRLARTVTGRDKIVIFTKDYHGNFDEVLVKGVGSGDAIRSLPIAPGIPRRAVDDMIVLPYGTDEALEIIRKRAHEVAAVIIEPIQSRRPEFQPREFIREVREITRQSGSVFVFDEVITGFRTGPHGAQEFYGVEADLATYGKVVGGGMPLGVVAGKAEYMDTFDGGMWQYGDDSFPEKGVTFFAGTFVRHPLAMVAVKEVLLHLKGKGPEFWQGVKDRATRLATTVDQMFVENNAPFRMPNFGSQMFIRAAEDHKYANLLFFHLRNKGVFLLEGFPTYMTAAHTDEDIDYCIGAFRESVAELQEGGFFDVPAGIQVPHLNGGRLTGPPRILTAEGSRGAMPAPQRSPEGGAAAEPELHPMTEPLAEVWLASQISENASLCFNEINLVTLRGRLNAEALAASLNDLVARHDALRSVFPASGDGFVVQPSLVIDLTLSDLRSLSTADREKAVAAALDAERNTPFDLEKGPLFRASLLQLADEEHLLVLNAHHIVCDGWAYNVVLAELAEIYGARLEGKQPQLTPALRFANHCEDTAAREAVTSKTPAEAHWMKEFAEPVHPLNLPVDFATPAEPDFLCETIADHFTPEQVRALRKIAGKSGATLFGLLFGAYQILLHRLGGQERFVVGFPAAGQNSPGKEGLVGHCVNFLPFVATLAPQAAFGDFLKATQKRLLDALDHQEVTYGRLIKKFNADDRLRIEAIFNLERVNDGLAMPGLSTEVAEIERGYTANPLFLKAREYEAGLEIRFDYQSSLYSRETVAQWLEIFRAILEGIVAGSGATVGEAAASLPESQRDLLHAWNATDSEYPRDRNVAELFEETALRRGDATAIRHDGGEMSYAELASLSDRLARSLAEAGASPGARVALFLDRSPEQVAAMIAVLKCGAAYVPLDPAYPAERLRLMLEDSGAALVLAASELADRIPKGTRVLTLDEAASRGRALPPLATIRSGSDDPAYVIYTSGSTGAPKGTVIPHRGIVRLVRETSYCRFGEDEAILQAATVCFDASVYEIYGALLNGGVLVLPPAGPLGVEALARLVREHGVTQLFLTTGLFQILVDERPEAFAGVRQVLTGGDIVSPGHMRRFLDAHPDCRLVHCYGPTENTTFTTCRDVKPDDFNRRTIPIGRPIANTTVWILDAEERPVQPGVIGELYTGGDGVGLGYLGNPSATEAKFLDDPFSEKPGAKLYRTGDLARFLPDGSVEFVGRLDHQVKIRGFRVEPGEIETQLGKHSSVRQAKVVVRGEGASDKVLVAYAGRIPGANPTPGELADYLRGKLPPYMMPSAIVVLDELPLNPSGKIDTKSLPDPGGLVSVRDDNDAREGLAATPTETELLKLWEDLLGASGIGLDDDFFCLGGHSLLGMKLFARLQKTKGVSLPLAVLFKAPTVRLLAAIIDERSAPAKIAEDPTRATDAADPPTSVPRKGGLHIAPAPAARLDELAETTVAIQPKGDLPPLFAIHGGDGGILFYGNLADRLGNDRPFYAFEAPALTSTSPIPNDTIEETASNYLAELRKVQPAGPYHLCGYSFGGVVAYEMARQLQAEGDRVEFLGLVDTENPAVEARKLNLTERISVNWNKRTLAEKGAIEKVGHIGMRFGTGLAYRLYFEAEDAVARTLPEAKGAGWLRQVQLRKSHEKAMSAYQPGPFAGKLTLFRAMVGGDKYELGDDYGWNELVDELEIIDVPGNHISVFHKENIDAIAAAFRRSLDQAILETA